VCLISIRLSIFCVHVFICSFSFPLPNYRFCCDVGGQFFGGHNVPLYFESCYSWGKFGCGPLEVGGILIAALIGECKSCDFWNFFG